MDKIFTHNTYDWIEDNNCNVGLSEINIINDTCVVPLHIYEDSLVEDDELDKVAIYKKNAVVYPVKCFNLIRNLRLRSYRACEWYPNIVDLIPTAKSLLIEINNTKDLENALKENLEKYPFVRTCKMSPKDVNNVLVYDNYKKAMEDLINSSRTNNILTPCDNCTFGKHLFLREKKEYIWEARCFWSHDKLRAVSLQFDYDYTEEDKNDILDFFKKYGKEIPYHSVTIDIGKVKDNMIECIEMNSFGPDMICSSGNFNWYEDVLLLLFSDSVVFR